MVAIMQNPEEKADLQQTIVNNIKTTKVHAHGNKLYPGKNEGHKPNSFGSRSDVVVRQADKTLTVMKF